MECKTLVTRRLVYLITAIVYTVIIITACFYLPILWTLILLIPLTGVVLYDITQKHSNILRNYPLWGHWRYLLLRIRPQIQAYFIENETDGKPFSHQQRFIVYNRAKAGIDTVPFGTQLNLYKPDYEWINQSMTPKKSNFKTSTRLLVGGPQCNQPYHASRLNISAMSFGAISEEAVRALNRGAKLGHFYQDTGEGGLSEYHLMEGGDLVWELGTGYFGCRTASGQFDPKQFQDKAQHPHVKMVEIKISQGAKPSHGAILPGAKVSSEIAKARGVTPGVECLSPLEHSTYQTPIGLLTFVQQIRELSGGKPAGFKLCIGMRHEFMSICKAMLETKIYPDFIVIDGAEGGTGAAPLEFSNRVGTPLNEGLIFAHNCLVGIGLRKHIRLIASGKIITGYDVFSKIALGADMLNSARGMMFALGCVQSRRCHLNTCPTGIATQDPQRRYALDIQNKSLRVKHFHHETLKAFLTLLGACGLDTPDSLKPCLIYRRDHQNIPRTYDQIFHYLQDNDLLNGSAPKQDRLLWEMSHAHKF